MASPPRMGSPAWRQALSRFLEAETTAGKAFEFCIFVLILGTIVETAVSTLPTIEDDAPVVHAFDVFEGVAVVIFTVEYLLRLLASPDAPAFRGIDSTGVAMLWHSISFYALIDFLAIAPWWV